MLTRCRSGTSAPTTAMQPEWLTSTVTAFAVRFAGPSSHSSCSLTREMILLCVRSLAQRLSRASMTVVSSDFAGMA